MSEMPPEDASFSDSENQDALPKDGLLDGLESILEEEGLELDSPELTEEDLLAPAPKPSETDKAPPAPTNRRNRKTAQRRRSRSDEQRAAFQEVGSHLQVSAMGLEVAKDKMAVRVTKLTKDNTFEEVLKLLTDNHIVSGIDKEAILNGLARARRGQNQFEVLVAQGKLPIVQKKHRIAYHLPKELLANPVDGGDTPFERLKTLLEEGAQEGLKSWQGPIKIVSKGQLVCEMKKAEYDPGYNVYGEPVQPEDLGQEEVMVDENITVGEDGINCFSEIYGYAGIVGGLPTVLPPILMSPDRMEAHFVYLSPKSPAPAPTIEELMELLELKWIESGKLEKQLQLIHNRLKQNNPLPLLLPIARGLKTEPGENAQIHYPFDPNELMPWHQFQHITDLKNALEVGEALAAFYAHETNEEIRFKAVRPGEVVAEKIPATAGQPGSNILGEEMEPEAGEDVEFDVGESLLIDEEGLKGRANRFGYVTLVWDTQVDLSPCLYLEADNSAAYFLNLPQIAPARYPDIAEMRQLLELAEIVHGYREDEWAETLTALEAGQISDYLVPVARATPPTPCQDADFRWEVEVEKNNPGKILEDGSIDYRDRDLTTDVRTGQILGRLIPPQPGVAGKDIKGKEIPAALPLNIEIITDSRIYAEPEKDGVLAFFADADGGLTYDEQFKTVQKRQEKRINIGVYPVTHVDQDVDYSTGNIDFNGDVIIKGAVQAQFSVKATGTVTIGGYVETGAYIMAGKDIMIKSGVVGETTELVAGGDIMAKFIQDAHVRAQGNVTAGAYMFNTTVRAGGRVIIGGKGNAKSRALVGGLVWGGERVGARSIGSPYNSNTRLVVGIDPNKAHRAEQIRTNIQACQEKQHQLLEQVDIEKLDLDLVKRRIAKAFPKQKQAILTIIKRVAKLAELEKNLLAELEEIATSQRTLARTATIDVLNELFAGVELRIGEEKMTIREDIKKVSLKLEQDEVGDWTINMDTFRGR